MTIFSWSEKLVEQKIMSIFLAKNGTILLLADFVPGPICETANQNSIRIATLCDVL